MTIDAGDMMECMQSSAEDLGLAWQFHKAEGNWHIEVSHVQRGFVVGVGQGDSFETAWNDLQADIEMRRQVISQELTRRRRIN